MIAARHRILIVDDEPEILVALVDLLEEEFDVHTTASPEEALAMLRGMPDVAVIISDQRMPGMNGDEFLIRAREYSHAKSILLTGYADMEAVVRALNEGKIVFYSHKPWDAEILRSMVRQACESYVLMRELAIERTLLDGLLTHIPAQLSFYDEHGRLVRINQRAADVLGHTVNDCLGQTQTELCPQGWRDLMQKEQDTLARGDKINEIIHIRPELSGAAQEQWLHVIGLGLGGQHAGAGGYSVTIRWDVTEKTLLQNRVSQNDKMQALGSMAGGIAHDFNNLLATIMGSLEMVQMLPPSLSSRQEEFLGYATQAVEKGAEMTQRLLDFSRQKDVQMEVVDIPAFVKRMTGFLRQSLAARKGASGAPPNIHCRIKTDAPLLAHSNCGQLELALLNLCINAGDAMPDGGNIYLDVFHSPGPAEAERSGEGGYVAIAVRDEGVGMDEHVQKRIFEPFFTTKAKGKGTGLGLAVIHDFMKKTGGAVGVESSPGQGTTITLYMVPATAGA